MHALKLVHISSHFLTDIACLSDPCENNGTCGVAEDNVHHFDCACVVGKNGTQCEFRKPQCIFSALLAFT